MTLHTFPGTDEYGSYYGNYVELAEVTDIKQALRDNRDEFLALYTDIDEDKMVFRYREGAWDLKEMIQHIIDSERVFAYRALCIARGDKGPFPGYEQDDYVKEMEVKHLSKEQLIFDFVLMRNSLISMFSNFIDSEWLRRGEASGHEVSVRALAHIILGHCRHHMSVINERYL